MADEEQAAGPVAIVQHRAPPGNFDFSDPGRWTRWSGQGGEPDG